MRRRLQFTLALTLALALASGCALERDPLQPQVRDTSPALQSRTYAPLGGGAGGVVHVPRDFATLQAAVAAATAGQKIDVRAGHYTGLVEVPVAGLWIHALGPVTLDGAFHVTADDVTIDGFTVRRQGAISAIAVEGTPGQPVTGAVIRHNVVLAEAGGGIDLDWVTHATVRGNDCSGATTTVFGPAGGGVIDLDHVTSSLVAGNTATASRWGISLGQFSESYDNVIRGNTCSGNHLGIMLHTTHDNRVELNVCDDNTGSGIDLQKANHGNVIGPGNVCARNARGLFINHVSSSGNLIKLNDFRSNTLVDIENDGDNTFFKNRAETTSGVPALMEVQRAER